MVDGEGKKESEEDKSKERIKQLINNLRFFKRISDLPDIQMGWDDLPRREKSIGVKKMGELADDPFIRAMKRKYNPEEAEDKGTDQCSLWKEYLRDPEWHPFKVITVNGRSEGIIDPEDEKLKSLKKEHGMEVYRAVTTALTEIMNIILAQGAKEYHLGALELLRRA